MSQQALTVASLRALCPVRLRHRRGTCTKRSRPSHSNVRHVADVFGVSACSQYRSMRVLEAIIQTDHSCCGTPRCVGVRPGPSSCYIRL